MTARKTTSSRRRRELTELRRQIAYLQEALDAISSGGVDAVVMGEPEQEQVYTLTSADRPYRVIVESMGEGAATVSERGVILFANPSWPRFLGVDRDSMIGRDLTAYVGEAPAGGAGLPARRRGSTETRRAELTVTGRGRHRGARSWSPRPTSTSTASWCGAWCSPT